MMARRSIIRRTVSVAGAALLALTSLSACGGATGDWTFEGRELVDVDESLETITADFTATMKAADVPVTVPEEARCYVQLVGEAAVQSEVLCGPVRYLGDEENAWTGTPVVAAVGDGDAYTLALDSPGTYPRTEPVKNAAILDGKGKPAKADLEIAAPPAPKAEVGQTMPAADSALLEEPLVIETPDATYTFTALDAADHLGEGTERIDAPDGGSFVTVGMNRDARSPAPNGHTSTAKLMVDGEEVEIPDGENSMALPGSPETATVDIEYDGNVQSISLIEKALVSGHPYREVSFAAVNAPQSVLIGDQSNGKSTQYQYSVQAATTSWDEEKSWAPEGKDRLTVLVGFDEDTQYTESDAGGTLHYRDKTAYTVSDLAVTVDGEKIPVDASALKVSPRADDDYSGSENQILITADVPIGAKSITVSGTVHREGGYVKDELNAYIAKQHSDEPATIEADLVLDEVVLEAGEQ